MPITIWRAGLADLERLMQWRMEVLRAVFSIPPDGSTDALEAENRRYYQSALPSGEHIACFASLGGQTAGCGGLCLSREMPSPDNPAGRCAYLMNIYTRPQFRGQGVGRAVVRWLVEQAARQGIGKIYLETSAAGRGLYEQSGFVPLPDMMILPPGNGPRTGTG